MQCTRGRRSQKRRRSPGPTTEQNLLNTHGPAACRLPKTSSAAARDTATTELQQHICRRRATSWRAARPSRSRRTGTCGARSSRPRPTEPR
uniref:Uncharacterized protein n=1 Tax=Zea mays TaxID=4577 RepID=C4IZZ1_MAIZE|nr:unknown [Zea mays]